MKKGKTKPKGAITKIAAILTPLEAAVITQLRSFEYGELLIKKKEDAPYQVISSHSTILTEKSGFDFPGGYGLTEKMVGHLQESVDLDKFFEKLTNYAGEENGDSGV